MKKTPLQRHLFYSFVIKKKDLKICDSYMICISNLSAVTKDNLLTANQKIEILESYEQDFLGLKNIGKKNEFTVLAKLFKREDLDKSLFLDVIEAYKSKIKTQSTQIWDEFLTMHRRFASPISRFFMALNYQNPSTYIPAENLFTIWEIMDYLFNLKQELSRLNRFIIPSEFLKKHGAFRTDFSLPYSSSEVKEIFEIIWDRLEAIQADSKVLPKLMTGMSLKLKTYIILSLTNYMIKEYKKTGIVASQVVIPFKLQIKAFCKGLYLLFFEKS